MPSAFDRRAPSFAAKLQAAGHNKVHASQFARWAVANLEVALVLARAAHDASIAAAAALAAAALDGRVG